MLLILSTEGRQKEGEREKHSYVLKYFKYRIRTFGQDAFNNFNICIKLHQSRETEAQ